MKRKILGFFLLLFALLVAFGIMFAPTFFTKNVSRNVQNKSFDLEHILSGEKSLELIFFGYAGCRDICSLHLASLAGFYEKLPFEIQNSLDVRFIDISSPADVTLTQRFAEYFHKDFKGLYLEASSLREYTKLFGVFFARSMSEPTEFDHTAHLYLVSKKENQKQIRYVYTSYPYDFSQIQNDIEELLNE